MANNEFGYDFVRDLQSKKIKSAPINGTTVEGVNSIINRYALFSYRGSNSIDTESIMSKVNSDEESALRALLSVPTQVKASREVTASSIINYFKNNDHNAVEYDVGDFIYGKHFGKAPLNHMVTLRRFPFAVEDNIFNKNIVPSPDIARVVSYFGTGTDNTMDNILNFSVGYEWKTITAEIQALQSQKFGNPLSGKAGSVVSALQRAANPNAAIGKDVNKLLTGQDFTDPIEMDGFYHNKVLGPVNVIDNMEVRERGLKYINEIAITVDYELKSYPGLSPKEAMLDIFSNLLTIGYNNAPFWGGAIRYLNDNRTSHMLGNQSLLLSGDYGGYLKSVGGDLQSTFSSIFSGGGSGGDFSFSSIIGGLMNMGKGLLSEFVTSKLSESGAVPNYQVANALLTGQATGEWHMTVGNPLNPICVMGNLVLIDMDIEFDETLGSDDFPVGLRAIFKLKPGRPRDLTDITNAFNLGQGRMYFIPETGKDILNIAGKETYHYGVVNGATDPQNSKDIQHKKKLDLHTNNTEGSSNTYNRFSNHDFNQIQNSLKWHNAGDVMQDK